MPYQTVALIGKPQHAATHDSLNILAEYLLAKGCKLLVEESIAEELETENFKSCNLVTIGKEATVGAGSTITREVSDNNLAVARGKQKNITSWQRPVKKS